MALVWSLYGALIAYAFSRKPKISLIIAFTVFSHWALDLIVWKQNLLTFDPAVTVGIGLYDMIGFSLNNAGLNRAGLEDLYREYTKKGLMVLGFPCDQFAHQEPAGDAEIAQFCQLNFGVTFPLMGKIDVNGKNEEPVFAFLKKRSKGLLGKTVKWNFTKFLVSPDGKTVQRFLPSFEPASLKVYIEKILTK